MHPSQPISLITPITALEERLRADSTGAYRAQLISQLERTEKRLQACLRQPCAPVEHRLYTQQHTAVENARLVIEAIWRVYHERAAQSAQPSLPLALAAGC